MKKLPNTSYENKIHRRERRDHREKIRVERKFSQANNVRHWLLTLVRCFSLVNWPHWLPLFACLLIGMGLISLTNTQPALSDSIGYIVAGQQLADGDGFTYPLTQADSYPLAYRKLHTSYASFGYPPGYAIWLALAIWLTGWSGMAYFVVPLLAIVCLALTYQLGKFVSGQKEVGLWGMLLFGGTAVFWQFGTDAWSEIPSTACLLAGVWLFLVADRRQRIGLFVIAGGLVGFSLFIRYTNVFLVIPALGVYILARQLVWRAFLFWGTIGLFGCGVLLYNTWVLGGPFHSIYSTPALGAYSRSYFSFAYAWTDGTSLLGVLGSVWQNFSWALLTAVIGLWLSRHNEKTGSPYLILLIGIPLSTMSLYSIYAFAPVAENARFLLPMFPFLSILLGWGIYVVFAQLPTPALRWGLSCVLLAGVWLMSGAWQGIAARNQQQAQAVQTVQAQVSQFTPDTIWLSTGWNDLILTYTDHHTLAYRRLIVPSDGLTEMMVFESCLVRQVDGWLAEERPLYFRWDTGWNAASILETQYQMVLIQGDIYQIVAPMTERPSVSSCPLPP